MKVHFNIDAVEALWNMRFWAGDVVTSFWNLMLWPVIRATALLGLILMPPVLQQIQAKKFAVFPLLPVLLVTAIIYGTGGYGIAGLPNQFSTISLAALLPCMT